MSIIVWARGGLVLCIEIPRERERERERNCEKKNHVNEIWFFHEREAFFNLLQGMFLT